MIFTGTLDLWRDGVVAHAVDLHIARVGNEVGDEEIRERRVVARGETILEVAAVVVFPASAAASFMTGAILPVAGGSDCGYGIKY